MVQELPWLITILPTHIAILGLYPISRHIQFPFTGETPILHGQIPIAHHFS